MHKQNCYLTIMIQKNAQKNKKKSKKMYFSFKFFVCKIFVAIFLIVSKNKITKKILQNFQLKYKILL